MGGATSSPHGGREARLTELVGSQVPVSPHDGAFWAHLLVSTPTSPALGALSPADLAADVEPHLRQLLAHTGATRNFQALAQRAVDLLACVQMEHSRPTTSAAKSSSSPAAGGAAPPSAAAEAAGALTLVAATLRLAAEAGMPSPGELFAARGEAAHPTAAAAFAGGGQRQQQQQPVLLRALVAGLLGVFAGVGVSDVTYMLLHQSCTLIAALMSPALYSQSARSPARAYPMLDCLHATDAHSASATVERLLELYLSQPKPPAASALRPWQSPVLLAARAGPDASGVTWMLQAMGLAPAAATAGAAQAAVVAEAGVGASGTLPPRAGPSALGDAALHALLLLAFAPDDPPGTANPFRRALASLEDSAHSPRPSGGGAVAVRRSLLSLQAPVVRVAARCGVRALSVVSDKAAISLKSIEPTSVEGCPRGTHWVVHKFGGTCMATAERMAAVAQLAIDDPAKSKLVVVSACGSHATSPVKVTDLLLNMMTRAVAGDKNAFEDLSKIRAKHAATAGELLSSELLAEFLAVLDEDITNIRAMLQAMSIARMSADAFSDYVVGHGELWSARLLTMVCRQMGADVAFMDARDVLVVTPTEDGTSVDLDEAASNQKLDEWFNLHGNNKLVIATGFIARNPQGQATTLKRNGSDFSATMMGALFRAGYITIWTDVDGVYSADPRKVPEAVCLPAMTYKEAWELAYFGANVLHPRTTQPVMKYRIPVAIRNFFNRAAPGTVITDLQGNLDFYKGRGKAGTITGFATIDNVVIINIEGTGLVGVPGIAAAVFGAMRDAHINVIMISQASSEQSICFVVRREDGDKATKVMEKRFEQAIAAGRVSAVQKIESCCVLAAVGQAMVNRKGSAATLMSALAKANINIKAMAQGSSEYNITVVVDQKDSERALMAVHSRFYLSDVPIGVGIVGSGLIGSALIEQLREQKQKLHDEFNIDIRVLGIASSKKMLLSPKGIDLDNWQAQMASEGVVCDLQKFGEALRGSYIPNVAIIDNTASDMPPTFYLGWMQSGIHIITPNKKCGSGPLEQYQAVRKVQRDGYTHFFYEGTVGAGLPILATVKQLQDTGDRVTKIEGILSGTLSYIFNTFGKGPATFSDIVADAKAKGYAEPDPRDDLNGTDVARKVVILARECGLKLELEDIQLESLVPASLRVVKGGDEYMARLPEFDGEMAERLSAAEASGEVLRYVGVVDVEARRGVVQLRRYPKSHPFAQLEGTDNIISFTTARYFKQALVVRGPGAGAEVTAGGVFGDLLRLAAHLGAPS
ncbi:hypothetical protein FOA52_009935 [Chlamydomonas sp. UWO 241]|nr:hypothetical protein FOA52_009935 [Chlamydomonas sp. UWO 241]